MIPLLSCFGRVLARAAVGCLATVMGGVAVAQSVNVWLTTADQQQRLQAQAAVGFATGSDSGNLVLVDEAQVFQPIEGFGASFTDSSAYLLNRVATATGRDDAMRRLFTREGDGIGLSFVRNPIGSCDYSRSHYSYDDVPAGSEDPTLAQFSIEHDLADIVPLVRQALALNPQLTLLASPWSPPAWMKTSGALVRGSLRAEAYGPFANYLVKYVEAYAAQGIPTHYLSLQNEPLYEPTGYPGMLMDAATQTVLLRDHVLPALAARQLTTKLLVYDHNWDRPDYPQQVLADATLQGSAQIAGTAWHGYGGTPGAMTTLANRFPAKGNYVTEHSGGTWIANQLKADFVELTHTLRNSARAYVKWNLALDERRGPFTSNGTSTCSALVTVDSTTGALTYNLEYYTLGHFSRFVRPGARRVLSTNATGVISVAFVNPDGAKVLFAFNDTDSSRSFHVQWGGRRFGYTLAASAAATFTWSGAQSGALPAPDARAPLLASNYTAVSGLQTEASTDTLGGFNLGYADHGDYALYRGVDFGNGVASVSARLASATGGGAVEFRLDSPGGPRLAALTVPTTGGWQTWQTVTTAATSATGVHDLYVVFTGGDGIANLNWFQFGTAATATAPQFSNAATGRTIAAGHSISFSASAAGYPAVTYRWQVSTNNGSTWSDLSDDTNHRGSATDTLTVLGATTALSGRRYRLSATNSAGTAHSATFSLTVSANLLTSPSSLVANVTGDLWVADSSSNVIARVPDAGATWVLAGAAGQQGATDGTGEAARFRQPGGLALGPDLSLYVVDTGNSLIRKVTSVGVVTTLAGSATNQGHRDGVGVAAWFNQPAALALDRAGNLYVADAGNSAIRKVAPDGTVSTVAGVAGTRGSADGAGSAALFNQPGGIAVADDGTLYVADTLNQTIRKISPAGIVSTWVGLTGVSGATDGAGSAALFNQPAGLCLDAAGNLYVADSGNSCLRVVTPAGVVSTFAGLSTVSGHLDGTGAAAWFNLPKDVKFDGVRTLYVADTGNATLRQVTLDGAVTTHAVELPGASTPAPTPTPTPTPAPAPAPSGGGGGGGGAVSAPAALIVFALLALRRRLR